MTALGLAVHYRIAQKIEQKSDTPQNTKKSDSDAQRFKNDVKMGVWGTTFPNFPEIGETLILNDPTAF